MRLRCPLLPGADRGTLRGVASAPSGGVLRRHAPASPPPGPRHHGPQLLRHQARGGCPAIRSNGTGASEGCGDCGGYLPVFPVGAAPSSRVSDMVATTGSSRVVLCQGPQYSLLKYEHTVQPFLAAGGAQWSHRGARCGRPSSLGLLSLNLSLGLHTKTWNSVSRRAGTYRACFPLKIDCRSRHPRTS